MLTHLENKSVHILRAHRYRNTECSKVYHSARSFMYFLRYLVSIVFVVSNNCIEQKTPQY